MKYFERQDVIELLSKLVGIRSPYFEEEEIMAFTKNWCMENGLNARIMHYHEKKITNFKGQNVLVELKGQGPGPKLCLNGHLDTVKLCAGWTKNPLGELDDDRFYGVGSLDMKGGVVAELLALKAFREDFGDRFKGEIIASFVSDEEGPFGLGTDAVIEAGLLKGTSVSLCTEPNPLSGEGEFPALILGAKGGYGLGIELFGKSAHASKPETGINAVVDAAAVVDRIKHIKCLQDPLLGSGVYCVLGIESEIGACSVPDFAKIQLFRHTVPGEDKKTISAELKKAIEEADIRSEWKIVFRDTPSEGTDGFMPYTVDEKHPYTKMLLGSIKAVCNKDAVISYYLSIGDFNYLGSRLDGAPVFVFGPRGENIHGSDEYVYISSIQLIASVIYDFMTRLLL
ncbi:MAG: M20 family metallopeptidase [Clostridiales bacterium]|nr:M20 family metallopeptidase [Clostridiales bacterium]